MNEALSDTDKEFASFLQRDFEQCFQQLRHYDAQVVDLLKFVFHPAYTALFAAALTLFQYGVTAKVNYGMPAASILFVGFVVGVCFVANLYPKSRLLRYRRSLHQ